MKRFLSLFFLAPCMGRAGALLVPKAGGVRSLTSLKATKEPEIFSPRETTTTTERSTPTHYEFQDWARVFEDQTTEFDFEIASKDIEGKIPTDIQGYLVRNGPARFYRGEDQYKHFLDGDGYITKISLDGKSQRARFSSKFVKTQEFVEEEAQERILYRSTFGTQPVNSFLKKSFGMEFSAANIFNPKLKNLANISSWVWAGKLLALFEAGEPYSLDPETLETIGPDNLGGSLPDVGKGKVMALDIESMPSAAKEILNIGGEYFNAHPKIDPEQKHFIGWSYKSVVDAEGEQSLGVRILELDEDMRLVHETKYKFLSPVAMHDWAVSPSYYIFMEPAVELDPTKYLIGLEGASSSITLLKDQPRKLHLVPRPGGGREGEEPQVLDLPPGFNVHLCHAVEDNEFLSIWYTGWEPSELTGKFFEDWKAEGTMAPVVENSPLSVVWKTEVSLGPKGQGGARVVSDSRAQGMEKRYAEHMHINPDYQIRGAPRMSYLTGCPIDGPSSPPQAIIQYDMVKGELVGQWYPGPRIFTAEPCIVPKRKRESKSSDDSDCWVLSFMSDAENFDSKLQILDGKDVSKGPVASITLPYVPTPLHGIFVEDPDSLGKKKV